MIFLFNFLDQPQGNANVGFMKPNATYGNRHVHISVNDMDKRLSPMDWRIAALISRPGITFMKPITPKKT